MIFEFLICYAFLLSLIACKGYLKLFFRSKETIDRKKAEARAEKDLAARKREQARRAKDDVIIDIFKDALKCIKIAGKEEAERRGNDG